MYNIFWPYTWAQARAICKASHGHLVIMETREEFQAINAYLNSGGHYWIGANDLDQEGVYVWDSSGVSVKDTFSKWAYNPVPEHHDHDCVYQHNYLWYCGNCAEHYSFVCEY